MLRYQCDNCARLKEANEVWLLGFAAENIGAVSARREFSMEPAWDDDKAVRWLAVHFCSDECRRGFGEKLFGADVKPVMERVEVIPQQGKTRQTVKARRVTKKVARNRTRRRRAA